MIECTKTCGHRWHMLSPVISLAFRLTWDFHPPTWSRLRGKAKCVAWDGRFFMSLFNCFHRMYTTCCQCSGFELLFSPMFLAEEIWLEWPLWESPSRILSCGVEAKNKTNEKPMCCSPISVYLTWSVHTDMREPSRHWGACIWHSSQAWAWARGRPHC